MLLKKDPADSSGSVKEEGGTETFFFWMEEETRRRRKGEAGRWYEEGGGGSNSRTSLKDPIYPKRIFSSLWLAVAPPCKINDPESPHWVFLVYSSCSMHVAAGCMHVYPEKVSQIEIEEGGERPKKG